MLQTACRTAQTRPLNPLLPGPHVATRRPCTATGLCHATHTAQHGGPDLQQGHATTQQQESNTYAGHQTGDNQWPRGQHEPLHRSLASSASGRTLGCTCKFAVVTESMWRQLIRKLKHVFPEAAVLVSAIVPTMGRLRKTVQVSNAVLLAVSIREKVSVINHTDAFTARSGAVRHRSTCTGTKCIPPTVARAGWCSASSLLQAPAVARLITTCQALNLNTDKTRHSPSSNRKESSNSMQPDLCCWDLLHPVLSLMHNIAGLLT